MKQDFYLADGTLFANNYTRVVIGGQGPYIEFEEKDILINLETTKGQEYRYTPKYYACKYYWLNPVGHPSIKVYLQKRLVSYADYRVGRFYVDPNLLIFKGELYAEKGTKPGQHIPCEYTKEN